LKHLQLIQKCSLLKKITLEIKTDKKRTSTNEAGWRGDRRLLGKDSNTQKWGKGNEKEMSERYKEIEKSNQNQNEKNSRKKKCTGGNI